VTSSFVLTVTGFSVTRSLSSFSVQFAPAAGFSIPTSQFKIDLTQLSALWFQSTASAAFGGEFALAVPFTFQGTPPTGKTLLDSIGTVSVTIANSLGADAPVRAGPPGPAPPTHLKRTQRTGFQPADEGIRTRRDFS
jgi:hypothetical protein